MSIGSQIVSTALIEKNQSKFVLRALQGKNRRLPIVTMARQHDKTNDIQYEDAVTPDVSHSEKVDKIDTLHNDEALIVINQYDGDQTWAPEEEKRLVRKIDRRLLPILVITFGLTFYDKVLLAHAVSWGSKLICFDLALTTNP